MADKKPYSSPGLVRYGSIVTLTSGAAGSGTDGGTAYMNRSGGNDGGGPPDMGMSDLRSKTNLVRVGTHPLGIGLYLFDYRAGVPLAHGRPGQRQFGVLAQEVETVLPQAVRMGADGLRLVDYSLLGIRH